MKVLVKFPTRNRTQKFLRLLEDYVQSSSKKDVFYLITVDKDDETLTHDFAEQCHRITDGNCLVMIGFSNNKIHACNRDLNDFEGEWDIVVLGSDDMKPMVKNWDVIIRDKMRDHFPNIDGALWFNDGHQARICTMTIMSRALYNEFKYLYHPAYTSLWCDNELTEVLVKMRKIAYFETVLFYHDHPNWTRDQSKLDAQYRLTESYFEKDRAVFTARKRRGFPI